ncbi:MAG TPA: adenylyltransferase/cytidyltransferase family protein [Terriglobales bacterium]|nr:adenylyltransferase/cytidyltransferase family protein [Terriglobales bacterium]
MASYVDKIVDRGALLMRARAWRARGETRGASIVLANGCFDVLHAGHVRYLRAAAQLAGKLVVAVNADASTRQLKGPGRPILPEQARAELVAALAGVAAVTIFPELTVEPLLRALRPDIHAKGTDYTPESVPEAALARELGIAIHIVGDPKHHATRDLFARIREERRY